jgi:hypothetical protein
MFNMCSANSMPDDPVRAGCSSWRVIGILCLLAALGYSGWRVYQQAERAYQPQLPAENLTIADTVAEEVEDERAGNQPLDLATFSQVVAPLFQSAPSLLAVRLWSPYQQLSCEITRLAPLTPHVSGDTVLPNLQANNAMTALRGQLADPDWVEPIAEMQLLQNEQSELSDALTEAGKQGEQPLSRRVVYFNQQNDILLVAQKMDNSRRQFDLTLQDMNEVLNNLTRDDRAIPPSLAASHKVEDDLSAALGKYRAVVSEAVGLPKEITARTPAPQSWIVRLLPFVTGRRVLQPIFLADADHQLIPDGFAEVIFYEHPAEALNSLTWKACRTPAIIFVLLLALICWPRRRVTREG